MASTWTNEGLRVLVWRSRLAALAGEVMRLCIEIMNKGYQGFRPLQMYPRRVQVPVLYLRKYHRKDVGSILKHATQLQGPCWYLPKGSM